MGKITDPHATGQSCKLAAVTRTAHLFLLSALLLPSVPFSLIRIGYCAQNSKLLLHYGLGLYKTRLGC